MQLTRPTDCEDRAYLAECRPGDECCHLSVTRAGQKICAGRRSPKLGLSSASAEIPSRSRGLAKFERLGGGFGFRSLDNWSGASLLLSRRASAPIFPNALQSDLRPIVARDGF